MKWDETWYISQFGVARGKKKEKEKKASKRAIEKETDEGEDVRNKATYIQKRCEKSHKQSDREKRTKR